MRTSTAGATARPHGPAGRRQRWSRGPACPRRLSTPRAPIPRPSSASAAARIGASAHGLDSIPEAHCHLEYAGRRVDITRSGIAAQAPIARFHREWSIEPEEIGAHKLALHQQYLRSWLRERRDLCFSLEELWRIREACILALGASGA
jgi:hypothetical protein